MKVLFTKSILLSIILITISCSNENEKRVDEISAQVEFELVFPNATPVENSSSSTNEITQTVYTACTNSIDEQGEPKPTNINRLKAHIKLERKDKLTRNNIGPDVLEQEVNIIMGKNNTYVTEPITLQANTEYLLTDIFVKGTDPLNPIVFFSGVNEGSQLAIYTSCTLPHSFSVLPLDKQVIEFPVICARGISSEAFGKPKFSIQNIDISCIPMFVDICNNLGESFIVNGNIILKKTFSTQKPKAADFNNLDAITLSLQSTEITYLCISDNLNLKDEQEWILIELNYQNPNNIIQTNTIQEIVSLDVIKNYQSLDSWDQTYKFFDVRISDNKKCIFTCVK